MKTVLYLTGSKKGFKNLKRLHDSGELSTLLGYNILDISEERAKPLSQRRTLFQRLRDAFSPPTWRMGWAISVVLAVSLTFGLTFVFWPSENKIDTTFQAISANKTDEMAEELRDVQFSWEAVDDANVFAFSQRASASAEAAKAFGAGLWTARESLVETRDITLPPLLLPPTPEDSWLKTDWAPYFELGRWTLLLWTASEFPDERPQSFWDQQRLIFDDFKTTFEARQATDNEAKKVLHQLNSRVKPHLEKLPAPDKPESYDDLAVNLENLREFLARQPMEKAQ
jgi:hypothetical protein